MRVNRRNDCSGMGGILGKGEHSLLALDKALRRGRWGKEFPPADLHEFPRAFSGRASLY